MLQKNLAPDDCEMVFGKPEDKRKERAFDRSEAVFGFFTVN
jgi:hypothetical protein